MKDLFKLILGVLHSIFKSREKLEAEILILRQQINVLRRRGPKRPHLNNTDRFLFVWLYHWFPSVLGAVAIVRPETIIRWHRAGFRAYWRWRSRNPVGRPKVSPELRMLIGEKSQANPHCRIDPASSCSSCHPAESGRPSSDNSSSCRPGKVIPFYGGFSDGRLKCFSAAASARFRARPRLGSPCP